MKYIKKQKGFTILEITFVLGIMAIMGGLTFNELRYTLELQRGHEAVSKMRGIYIAALQYYMDQERTFSGISVANLCTQGYLDRDTCGGSHDGVGRAPWGGDYVAYFVTPPDGSPQTAFQAVGIGATNLPYQGGNFIASELGKDLTSIASYDATNTTASVVYYSSN